MKYILKNYQRDAIDEIKDNLNYLLTKKQGNKNCVLKAPTGSGKTLIVSTLINELATDDWKNKNFCIIWACPGKGSLHEQSYDSVKSYLNGFPICSLIDREFFGTRKYIKDKEIVFVNWEKLVQKDSDTGKWVNNIMRDQEGSNFIDVIDQTKRNKTLVLLVIDESHIGKSQNARISEFCSEIICADLVLEMSATPINNREPDIIIKNEDVINEGMIKKQLIFNEGIFPNDLKIKEIDSEKLVLIKGFEKRKIVKEEYEKNGIFVNPLVLIQIPNTDAGEAKKMTVRDFLRARGVTEENGKLKLWCDKEDDFDKREIKRKDDITEFLIFKTSVATGWDCPRAQILVKFRDSKSETFETQTIGRILRMPEAKHYNNELLDNSYMFTNLSDFKFDKDSYNPNAIKTEHTNLREGYNVKKVASQLCLHSFYISRAGFYNTVTHDYVENEYFDKEFVDYFNITTQDVKDRTFGKIKSKLISKGMNLDIQIDDSILTETNVNSKLIDSIGGISNNLTIVRLSQNDLNINLAKLIKENLNGFSYKRSIKTVLNAIRACLTNYLNIFDRAKRINCFDRIIMKNSDIFAHLINKSTLNFKKHVVESIRKGKEEKNFFEIIQTRSYSSQTHIALQSKKSLYQPLYVLKENDEEVRNELERDFINYLDNLKEVEWFWQNGPEPNQINFGIGFDNDTRTFYPDFLVKFIDGTVGIFDTKAVDNPRQNVDTAQKARALFDFIKKNNNRISTAEKKTPRIVGGIVIQPNKRNRDMFYFSNEQQFKLLKEDPKKWRPLFELIKKVSSNYIKHGGK